MPAPLTYPHIEKRSGEAARLERIPRVRVAQIAMDHLAHGWSAEEICRQHSYLTVAEAHVITDRIEARLRSWSPKAVLTIHVEPADGRFRGPRESREARCRRRRPGSRATPDPAARPPWRRARGPDRARERGSAAPPRDANIPRRTPRPRGAAARGPRDVSSLRPAEV